MVPHDRLVVERLRKQWPKRCGCGQRYSTLKWLTLEYAYTRRDDFSTQEARHCTCGSTIVVDTVIHDLSAE